MLTYLSIALGGAIGSVGRYWFSGVVAQQFGETFPYGTLLVNISGSFIIGFFVTMTDPDGKFLVPETFRQFFTIGVCGGYTTFSSFSLQTLRLAREGDWLKAGANILFSVALCLVAVWLGHVLAAWINNTKAFR